MKKIITAVVLSALVATAVYAGTTPGTGVLNSPHDMNTVTGLNPDSQGRVCAFCHTPHHAVDLAGAYNPLWSHTPTAIVGLPYISPTFDAANTTVVDPLQGPSRLCMSCHDGAIAPDQHYGNAPGTPTGRFASDSFSGEPTGAKNIAVGLGGEFGNDHPIGFDVTQSFVDPDIDPAITTGKLWLKGAGNSTRRIDAGLFQGNIMTCATCHDVHNKDNVENNLANETAGHTDTLRLNYFVYAPQSGSQLCLSCHRK